MCFMLYKIQYLPRLRFIWGVSQKRLYMGPGVMMLRSGIEYLGGKRLGLAHGDLVTDVIALRMNECHFGET